MYLDELVDIAYADVDGLLKAEKSYGDSWKKRGGVGAFMMLARKWDRIEKQLADVIEPPQWDIFAYLANEAPLNSGLIDDIRDLRRYLMLVEAEMRARGKETEGKGDSADVSSEDVVATPIPGWSSELGSGKTGSD